MSDETATPTPETTPAPGHESTPAPAPAPAPVTNTAEPASEAAQETHEKPQGTDTSKPGISTLDDALKVIADLRKENARNRTNAKETAANEARQDIAQTIAKALGLTPEADEEQPDPAAQVQALTAQIEETRTRAEQAALELAIYRSAAGAGANPDALLDSRAFMSAIATIDPADPEAVKTAITEAAQNNPNLRALQASGPNRIDHTPGGSSHAEPKSLTEALSARYQ